jgi:hypothetical protein
MNLDGYDDSAYEVSSDHIGGGGGATMEVEGSVDARRDGEGYGSTILTGGTAVAMRARQSTSGEADGMDRIIVDTSSSSSFDIPPLGMAIIPDDDRPAIVPTIPPPTTTSHESSGPINNGGERADEIRIDDDDGDHLLRDLRRDFEMQSNPPLVSLMYGLINTTIVLPIVMSFGSIIYRDDFFRPYLSGLIQLTIVSGAIHQISFSALSTLPFAVGSVQDAGEEMR